MLNVGLTGGIASGKSTVDSMFSAKGAYLIDHDSLARRVVEKDRPAWKGILTLFGPDVLLEDGSLNRLKLGEIIFGDDLKRTALNDIVHPAVFREWKKEIEDVTKQAPHGIIISDIPLLFEVGWQDAVDVIVLVYISRDEQIRRLSERNGYTTREAEDRLNAQMPIDEKVLRSDYIINNEGLLDKTREDVDRVWAELIEKERLKSMKGRFFKLKKRS
jgi:dephospho-CoA kinase